MIQFGVLGPLTVSRDDRPLVLNATMLRALLTLLLHRPGQPLSVATILDTLWPGQPPATARKTVQVYAGRLRKALGDEQRVRHSPGGYTIIVAPGELDAAQFRTLLDAGRDARERDEPAAADGLFTEALRLWRGMPFADLDGADVVADQVRLLEEQRLAAHELRAAVRLDMRRHHEMVGDLAGLLTAHPFQERLAAYLMLALYRSDRQSEALDLYRRVRDQLSEELGIEPGPTMSWLQQAILRTDHGLWRINAADLDQPNALARLAHPPTSAPAPPAPAQLPPDVSGFAGRDAPLADLDALLTDVGDRPTAVVISAVSGTAGVGKTALAVHWAHRIRHRFPDGQLYVNLRGFDPTGIVITPAEAIRRFLDALDVSPQRIPADPSAQADLYRTLLSEKRMLIVLDNARDPDQVRPLLPGAPGCLVLVTSRNRLTGLIAAEGAHPLPLDLLTQHEARDLLTRRLGPARVAAEPVAVDELITCCARLPLALAVAAARAATLPRQSLAALAGQLRDSRDRLGVLSTGDTPATDVRAVFSWSYRALGADAARLFRLLGLHPGPDISTAAAASLAALPIDRAWPLLSELATAHLVAEHTPGRFILHDLLRAYAADLAQTGEPDQERRTATARVLDHYLRTAHAADGLLNPCRDARTLTAPQPGIVREVLAGPEQALDWFTAEHRVLLAAVEHAAAAGYDAHTWQLALALDTFLNRRGHWQDQAATKQAAVAAAGRLGDLPAQARAYRYLARAHIRLGRLDEAHAQLLQALDLSARAGDQVEEGYAHHTLAHVWERQRRYSKALGEAQQALDLFQAAAYQGGLAAALNAVGWYHALLGDHEQALVCCQQALVLHQNLSDVTGQAATWDSLGYAQHQLGNYTQAVICYEHALDLYRQLRDRFNEADTLANLGDTHHTAENPDAARTAWQHALMILEQLNHPDAHQVRTKLHDLTRPRPGHAVSATVPVA